MLITYVEQISMICLIAKAYNNKTEKNIQHGNFSVVLIFYISLYSYHDFHYWQKISFGEWVGDLLVWTCIILPLIWGWVRLTCHIFTWYQSQVYPSLVSRSTLQLGLVWARVTEWVKVLHWFENRLIISFYGLD